MFDLTQIRRDDVRTALAVALALGIASFATGSSPDLSVGVLSAGVMAAIASLTVLLFAALE